MAASEDQGQSLEFEVIASGCETMRYKVKEELLILGSLLDSAGSTATSVNYRLGQAERAFWSAAKLLCAKGTITAKLDAWESKIVSVAMFGCKTWHLSSHLLHRLRVWELHCLRKVFQVRPRPWNCTPCRIR